MSGLDVYGALAATAGLVKFAIEVKKSCNKTAEKLKALEQAKASGTHQIASLRIVLKTLASSFDKYNAEVEKVLSQKDKDDIGEVMRDATGVIERCEGIVSKLKALTKKKLRSKSELDVLREELNTAISTIQCLQTSFNTHINLETLRRVSRGKAENEPYNSQTPLDRRDSELETIAPASSQGTVDLTWSTQILTPTLSPKSTYTTDSSSRSTSYSTNSSRSVTLVESKQLRSAVDENDGKRIEQLIRQKPIEGEKESLKASALFLACIFRRISLVQLLLPFNPNVFVIDESGLGVMHAAIGLSEQLSDAKEKATAKILELLVDYHPPLIRSADKEKRQPLHYCAMTGNYRAAQYILNVDRNRINATDSSKKTPLYHICEHHSPNKRLVKLLLQNGGDFGTRNRPRMKDVRLEKIKKMLDDEEKTRKLTLPS
ncbi:hypothetical protein IMSHALPRED_008517 [Imshaugia aleurites]|uniref:Uncharacterized protein n=1 Tax=Imshaugia aleurites TaxID=172621 RepID=A0A8H3EQV3_9LECA|nr:hypothetical protein IMSHALPRED_008517 [Imshaugia aleurites]